MLRTYLPVSLSFSLSFLLDASESSESTIKSQRISTASQTSSIKSVLSKDKSSGSESSVTEDIKATASVAADNAAFEESRESDGAHKTSKTTIPEQYGDDSFYTPSARTTVSKSISYQPDNLVTSSVRSSSKRRYSKDSDESKSEDDVSLAGKLGFLISRFLVYDCIVILFNVSEAHLTFELCFISTSVCRGCA